MDTKSPESDEGIISAKVDPDLVSAIASMLHRTMALGSANVKISYTADTQDGNLSERITITSDANTSEPSETMSWIKSYLTIKMKNDENV